VTIFVIGWLKAIETKFFASHQNMVAVSATHTHRTFEFCD